MRIRVKLQTNRDFKFKKAIPELKCTPNVRQKNLMFGGAFFLAKHLVEVKLNSVLYYLNNNTSLRETSEKFNVDDCSLKEWAKLYEQHGVEGLADKNGFYDGDFKLYVVEYMRNTGIYTKRASQEV